MQMYMTLYLISRRRCNHQSPISLVGGEFLFMRVINAIVPIVEKEVKKEMQASEKRMSKYTGKYNK